MQRCGAKSWYLGVAAVWLCSPWLVSPTSLHAEEPFSTEGFKSLFDGKTLSGWHKNPEKIGHGTGGQWTVEDGVITGRQDPPGSGNGGILLTDEKFEDFELVLEMKPDWGVCSGLFLRSNDRGECFQVMVDYHDAGSVGHIYGEGIGGFSNRPFDIFGEYEGGEPTGKLLKVVGRSNDAVVPKAYSITPEAWSKAWKVGEWNQMHVRIMGSPPQITTWLNGEKVTEFDGKSFDGLRYDAKDIAKKLGTSGSIAVQVHGGNGWPKDAACRWRNIKIKPLAAK